MMMVMIFQVIVDSQGSEKPWQDQPEHNHNHTTKGFSCLNVNNSIEKEIIISQFFCFWQTAQVGTQSN